MIIDFHTHLFPDKIAQRAIKALTDGIIRIQGSLILPPVTDGTHNALLSQMRENGIDTSVVMPIATKPSQQKTINEFAEEITDDEKIISFGSIHPEAEDWADVLGELTRKGIRGIKLHPEFQSFYVDEPVCVEIVRKSQELGLWVLFHCGADFGFEPPFHCTPERLRRLIDITGGENIIAAHMGGFMMWDEVEKYLVGTPVMMDTSMAADYLDIAQYRRIIKNHGEDKFLFGSDSPWQSSKKSLNMLYEANLGEEATEKIKHINAEKVLRFV